MAQTSTVFFPPMESLPPAARSNGRRGKTKSNGPKDSLSPEAVQELADARGTDHVHLYEEPQDDILLLGEMARDGKLITGLVQGLALSGEQYRGNLRVIAGAAKRMYARCGRLLGEIK